MIDTLTIIIIGGILLIAIIIAFLLANRTNWRILKSSPAVEESDDSDSSNAVDHYTEARDELTLEDAGVEDDTEFDEEVEEESSGSGFSIIGIISLTIAAVVFSTIWSTIKPMIASMNTTDSGMNAGTLEMTKTVMGWAPIVMIIGFVFVIITMFGLGSSSSSSSSTIKKKRKRGVKHYTSMRDKLSEK